MREKEKERESVCLRRGDVRPILLFPYWFFEKKSSIISG